MEFTQYIRKPFTIEAVQITDENIDELCPLIGHEVLEDDETGDRYIRLDRRIVKQSHKAFAGHWITRMDGKFLRVYSPNSFIKQFVEINDENRQWLDQEELDSIAETEAITDDPDTMSAIEEAENEEKEDAQAQEEVPQAADPVQVSPIETEVPEAPADSVPTDEVVEHDVVVISEPVTPSPSQISDNAEGQANDPVAPDPGNWQENVVAEEAAAGVEGQHPEGDPDVPYTGPTAPDVSGQDL